MSKRKKARGSVRKDRAPARPAPEARPRRRFRAGPVIGAAVLVLGALAAVYVMGTRKSAFRPGAASDHNVLLITLDTTRADRLGCYGYGQARTPHIRRPGPRRGPVRPGLLPGPADPARPQLDPDGAPSGHARGPEQRPRPRAEVENAGGDPQGPRLRHGGLRLVILGRFPVRNRPGLRRLRRHLPAPGAAEGRERRAPGRGDVRQVLRLARRERRDEVLRLGPLLRPAPAL